MGYQVDDLLQLLDLEPLEVNIYRGTNRDIGSGRVFGGQVLAQALVFECADRVLRGSFA
jgi:acyl-CoA thioesterase-2